MTRIAYLPLHRNDRQVYAMDSRETAPLASTPDMFVNRTNAAFHGNLAIAVPGEVAGYYQMWSRFGRLPWRQLFEPSIKLCLNGMPVTAPLRTSLDSESPYIWKYEQMRKAYVDAGSNKSLSEGQIRYDPVFARTLQRIADDPFSFYNGSLADDILLDACEDTGTYNCVLTRQDLLDYKVRWRAAPAVRLRSGHSVHLFPLPSASLILAPILRASELYGLAAEQFDSLDSAARLYHRLAELFKFAFAERVFLGDDLFANVTQVSLSSVSDLIASSNDQLT